MLMTLLNNTIVFNKCKKFVIDSLICTSKILIQRCKKIRSCNINTETLDLIKEKIIKSDIIFKIEIINEITKEIKEELDDKIFNESIKKCLIGLDEILENINDELMDIENSIEYHKTKYFYYWRSFNCKNTKNFDTMIEVLDKRYDLLCSFYKLRT